MAGYHDTFTAAEPESDYAGFWAEHAEWVSLFSFLESKLNAALDRFRQRGIHHDLSGFSEYLLPYLLTLYGSASHRTTVLLYATIGALGTADARNYLLEELESEGRHPFTPKILRALTGFQDQQTASRLAGVYKAGKLDDDGLQEYLLTVGRFGPKSSGTHVEHILREHPDQVENVVIALQELEYSNARIARLLLEQFAGPQEYPDLDRIVRAVNGLDVTTCRVDLAAMNARADDPEYIELPPVNWPQQLEEGWAAIVQRATHDEVMQTVEEYLSRPEPRLQRNAILQLKAYRSDPSHPGDITHAIEERMRELLRSRFDKVYVEILNILGARPLELRDRRAMLSAILEISIGSRYRFVVLKALRRTGGTEELKEFSRRFYARQIEEAETPQRLEQIAALLPFLEKYPSHVTDLKDRLRARQATRG